MANTHALNRTSPKGKGQTFIGTCFKCGETGLPAEAVGRPCENPANLTRDETIMVAIAGPSRKLFLNRSEVVGTLAMWAVRQCPYPVPERLEAALAAVDGRLTEAADDWFWLTEDELRALVLDLCLNEPEVAKWNEPRSGHGASMVFSSRYDSPSPDDDFIDLHALANNISRTLIADQHDCDSGRLPEGEDSRSEAKCAASQSGGATSAASPIPTPPNRPSNREATWEA